MNRNHPSQPTLPKSEDKNSIDINEKLSIKDVKVFLGTSIIEGILVFFYNFRNQSDPESAVFIGYSQLRIILGILTLCLVVILFFLYKKVEQDRINLLNKVILERDHLWYFLIGTSFISFLMIWGFVFTWLFIPNALRPHFIWGFLVSIYLVFLLRLSFNKTFSFRNYKNQCRLFPSFSSLSVRQKRVFYSLCALSFLYVLILLPSNFNGTKDMNAFAEYGGDEFVIYPILMNVMKSSETFSGTLYHIFIYEDYHYGYPFYAASALVLLPFRIIFGEQQFANMIHVNLPLLRIFISVIPVILSTFILVWLFTSYQNVFISIATFLFILIAPGTLQNNQGFWHPDGLNLFFICMALYYLQKDNLRLGRFFYLSSIFIGLSAATRLYGFFFVLSIAVYIFLAIIRHHHSFLLGLRAGFFFLGMMIFTILFSSPFLFRSDAREKMVSILSEKTNEMSYGYEGDYDPRNDYRTGWDAWYPAFEDHYTKMYCFVFLQATIIAGCFIGKKKLLFQMLLCWEIMIGGYLVFFVAVKSTQYVLPFLLPVMATVFSLPQILTESSINSLSTQKSIFIKMAWGISTIIYASQMIINCIKDIPRFF